jgi:3-phenylpropionate/trans-cinnamate dioxygenase ferredoxin subunit
MPNWVKVADEGDIPLNKSAAFEVAGQRLLVARLEDGFFAVRDLCSHQSRPLQGGAIEGGAVECPFHGARFDLRTGARLSMPAIRGVAAFAVRAQGGSLLVDAEQVERELGSDLD